MKKIINDSNAVLDQMLNGFACGYSDVPYRVLKTYVVAWKEPQDQVCVVSGGVSGHQPAHAGFAREAMLQAVACCEMFAKLKAACSFAPGQRHAIFVNGLGATPLMEQYIFANDE